MKTGLTSEHDFIAQTARSAVTETGFILDLEIEMVNGWGHSPQSTKQSHRPNSWLKLAGIASLGSKEKISERRVKRVNLA